MTIYTDQVTGKKYDQWHGGTKPPTIHTEGHCAQHEPSL